MQQLSGKDKALPQSGALVMIDELTGGGEYAARDGMSVRVLGRLHELQPARASAVLEDPLNKTAQLRVDYSDISAFNFAPPALLQVVGELRRDGDAVVLGARVVRSVDGMDVGLYKEALALRRRFLQAQEVGGTAHKQ
eukprot:TRINITY_DN7872_c0_g1_i2.p2 TRINITY_DN7872_c0_g1~~TRINITY_DN7872_c0_g1_i2.p2  ORF type:complete len:138 (+),score=56.24 TRINITY_DN7872_c0_g1_i2:3-416(+)